MAKNGKINVMTTPSWRKWFSHCTRTVAFALRGFFAFILEVTSFVLSFFAHAFSETYKRHGRTLKPLIHGFLAVVEKLRAFFEALRENLVLVFLIEVFTYITKRSFAFYRKHRRVTVLSASLLMVVFFATSIFFSYSARAEKEVHAYISPSFVSGEGVENPTAAAVQDLSIDARVADFDLSYSARFAFGSYAVTERAPMIDASTTLDATSSAASTTAVDSVSTSSPAIDVVSSTSTSTEASAATSSTSSAVDTAVPSAPVVTATSAPSIIDSIQTVIHNVLPAIVPAPESDTVNVAPATATMPEEPAAQSTVTPAADTSTTTSASARIGHILARYFTPHTALAQDVPSSSGDQTQATTAAAPAESSAPAATSDGGAAAPSSATVSAPVPAPAPSTVVTTEDASATAAPAPVESVSAPTSNESSTSAADVGTDAGSVADGASQVDTPDDRDPYKVASCTLFGKQCHLLVMEGFGVGPELSKYPVRNAQLMVSIAGRAAPQDDPDRVIFRAYRNGKWVYLGEQQVTGEFDNSSRGGFLTFPLGISSWSELANMTISVEYVRDGEADASVLLDAAWVDVGFAADEAPDDLALLSPNVKSALLARDAERRIKERDHLKLEDGTTIDFNDLVAETPGAKLRVAMTKDRHAVLGSGEDYVSVTNVGKNPEHVRLSFHFPENGGRVTDIAQYSHNVPHKVVEARTAPIAYVCSSGWVSATSSDVLAQTNGYSCADSNETHVCASLSDDKTSCLSEVTAVGQQEDTVYRRDFVPDAIYSGSFRDDQNIFGRAMDALLSEMPSDILPTSVHEVSYTNPFDIEPGATQYFRFNYDTQLNTRGDIYVEAVAASGAYGLGHTEFDGSWNWRMPIDVTLPYAESSNEVAVPIALNKMPLEFWNHVKNDGSDIRFSDEDGLNELPYWIADFDIRDHTGMIWVRMPQNGGIIPRIYVYAGNPDAEASSKPWAPFTTSVVTPRAVLMSPGGEEADVTITALAPQLHVVVDGHDERTLLYGETALFEHVANNAVIRATGPISAKAHSVFGRAVAAPLGLSGLSAVLPEYTRKLNAISGTYEGTTVTAGEQSMELTPGNVSSMDIDGEQKATSSVPTLFVAEDAEKATLIAENGKSIPEQLAASAVLDHKERSVRAACEGHHIFGAYDARGSLLATSTCGVTLSGPFDEGTLVRMFRDQDGGTVGARFFGSNDADGQIVARDVVSRTADAYGVQAAFGEPEFVLPGEHRLFDRLGDKEVAHVNRFLSAKREFSAEEVPTFKFQYKPQSNSFLQSLRKFVGMPAFSVDNVVVEQSGKPLDIETSVEYGTNNEWTVRFAKDARMRITPGKLTLRMQIHEGSSTYEDSYDFYWALLAVNFNKATYEQGETAQITMGALSDTGNTICDARLKLFVTTPASTTIEVPVTASNDCNGNNITDVPDYTASYTPVDAGKYMVRLVRLDDAENILADVRDTFSVVPHMTYVIERSGPTRINPTALYNMTLRVFSREPYKGKISDLIPGDFDVVERGGGTLDWTDETHAVKRISWDVDMNPGEVYQFTYRFDAPDISPYMFFLGPATIGDGANAYTEPRTWQVASDAAGKMIIYWTDGMSIPAGWDLVSSSTGPFFDRWAMGSSTYGITGGATTHTHTFTTSVSSAVYTTAVPAAGTTNFLSYKDHTHAFTPTFGDGSNLPPSLSLRVLRSQTAGEVNLPAGAAVLFESIPSSGWNALTSMEGNYPYGENSVGMATGSPTHAHSVSGTLGAPTGGPTYARRTSGTYPYVSTVTHTHTLISTTTPPLSNDPPYVTYRLAQSTAAGPVPNDAITMWDADPAAGWINLSSDGGVLSNRFVKIAAAAGATGGHASHDHPDLLGLPTNAGVGSARATVTSGSLFGADPNHTHTVDLASFSTTSNLPPFITVVFAKRSVGIPMFSQTDYRFYDNVNDLTPVDPWPAGAVDVTEDMPVADATYRFRPGSVFRVRMGMHVENATSTAGLFPLKLQYAADNNCASALNWNDVGAPGSGAPLMGYDNTLVNEGAALPSALLSTTTPGREQAYRESSGSVNFVNTTGIGENAEWDWSLEAGTTLASSTQYCLRMVEDSGKILGAYQNFPSFITNNAPFAPDLKTPFNHEKISTTTPTFTFSAADDESNTEHYEVQIDTDPNFGAPFVDLSTTNAASNFLNVNNPTNKAPYTSGDTVQFTVPQAKALTNNTTYWWRVRAKDPTGSTQYSDWSIAKAITVDTSLNVSAWFQTTDAQFAQDVSTGLTVTGNAVRLASTSTSGTIVSPELIFSEGTMGTVWGSLEFTKDAGGGITFQIEYKDLSGTWSLVPDSLIPGNSTGLSVTTSLKALDPQLYPSLRVRANFTNTATPVLSDWTIKWAYKTLAPTITSPFSHASVASSTPFVFSAIDPQSYPIRYWFSYSTDPTFAASTTCYSDTQTPTAPACGTFTDMTSGGTAPFASGHTIKFVPSAPLTSGTTYYYRIAAYGVGGGAWSFWSDTRAVTAQAAAPAYTTWFQTMAGQFKMDTLSGVYANTSNSVAVATTSDRVLMVYGSGSNPNPKYRFYEAGALGAEGNALSINSTVLWSVAKASPAYDQFILGTMGADRAMSFQVFENDIWSRMLTMPASGPSATRKSFDVAYEALSGRAVAVACNGMDASYAVFDGSTWGAVQSLNLPFTTNCELVKLASNPIQNQILALFRNTGSSFTAEEWDGTQWVASREFTFSASAGVVEPAHDAMDIEFERTSGRAVAIVGANTTRGFRYRIWGGSNWSGAEAAYTNLGGGATIAKLAWGKLVRDPASNDLELCTNSQYSATDDGAYTDYVRFTNTAPVSVAPGEYWPYSRHAQSNSCIYETKPGRTGRLMVVADESWAIADGSATNNHTIWDARNVAAGTWQSGSTSNTNKLWTWSGTTYQWGGVEAWTTKLARASASGDVLAMILSRSPSLRYMFSIWNGSAWTTPQNIATPSVSTKPYGAPFDLATQEGLSTGRIYSSPINFADGQAPAWRQARFNTSIPGGSTALVSLEYLDPTGNWTRIPDNDLPGNSVGTSTSPIDLSGLNVGTYTTIRLRADLACNGLTNCPTLNDWTVDWAQGLAVGGIARDHDRTTVLTSGTVSVAVNGVPSAQTGSIDATGHWTIPSVSYRNGDVVTAWINNPGAANRAVAVAKFMGAGSLSNMELSRRWLTLGDLTQTGETISNADLGLIDYRNETSGATSTSIFHNVDASGNLTLCASTLLPCPDASLAVLSGTTWRPQSTGSVTNTMYAHVIEGETNADANIIKISGDWRNSGIFTPGTGRTVFNATSSVHTIDNTGASQYKFNDVTFGESATTATWQTTTPLYLNGSLAINYGTLSPGAQPLSIESSLSIGANGKFTKGTATTTFLGVPVATWSDLSSGGQDLGNILIDGSPKSLSLSSGVHATNVTIASGDTLFFGVNTLSLSGSFENDGTVNGGTGKLLMAPVAAATIKQGSAVLNNVTLQSGSVSWVDTSATTSGDVLVSGGAHTLPVNTLTVGGGFTQTGGTFTASNQTILNGTSANKQMSAISSFKALSFTGTGSWNFISSATTTGELVISGGAVTLPSGTLTVGGNFSNTANIVHNGGTLFMNGGTQTIALGGKTIGGVTAGGTNLTFVDTNVIAAGSIIVNAGSTLNFPTNGSLTVGGSFINNGTANANASLLSMNRASGAATLSAGTTVLSGLGIAGGGNFTIVGNTRVSATTTIGTVGSFTMQTGNELRVDGFFTNAAANVNTTWTGSTLRLTSGATMSINTKNTGDDDYGAIILDNGTQLRMWNSTATSVTTNAGSSLYGQNWGAVSGALRIYGTYSQNSGSAYWNNGTDFDGTLLSTPRPVAVAIAGGSTLNFVPNTALEIVGAPSATTTVSALSGTYAVNLATSTLSAQYATLSNLGIAGISITGSSTLAAFDDVDISAGVNSGYAMTLTKEVIDANAGKQYAHDMWRSGGFTGTKNVRVTSASTNYIRFKQHGGNIAGENFDNDPSGDPGEVRWDDSSYIISVSGTVYDKNLLPMGATVCDGVTAVVRVQVTGGGAFGGTCGAGGNFTVNGVTFSGETTMSIYLKGNPNAKAVTVTRGASVNLSGIALYQDRVILRHEDTLAMTNAALAGFDADNDPDMLFTSNSGTLNIPSNDELWIWAGKTFTPGGNVTTGTGGTGVYGGALHIDNGATLNAQSTELFSIGGRLQADSGAVFNTASSTVQLTATDARTIAGVNPFTFWNLSFTGTGSWSLASDIAVANTFDLASGTLLGTGNITTQNGATGAGALAMTGGTFALPNGGSWGGPNPWTAFNLTLGDGTTNSTTTKSGVGTTTVAGVLTVSMNHDLDLATHPLTLTATGTPLVVNGTIDTTGSTVTYASAGATNVTNIVYNGLTFLGSGTYTLPSLALVVKGNFTVGDGITTPTVTGLSGDPLLSILGDVSIASGATYIASDAATTTVKGNWTNAGTFTNSLGLVQFIGSGVKTIAAGNSAFGRVDFNDPLGSWTLTGNTTASVVSLSDVSSWTLASGKTLEIDNAFLNLVGSAKTTWTGSTLYLNTGNRVALNTKTSGADVYNILKLGVNTEAVMWNSSSTQMVTAAGSGVLSMNHAGVNGDLYIFGDYKNSSAPEYWDYTKDFDGETLGTPRAARVRFASGATATYSGTSILEMVGDPSATTTVRALSGTYGLTIGGATTSMQYLDISDANTTGVSLTGSVKVAGMNDVVFRNPSGTGSMMTVAGSVISANPVKIMYRLGFIASGGNNVTATGTTASAWRFVNHYGGRDGEAYDNDPAGNPGYLIWDDSTAQFTLSGHFYKSDGVTVSSACNGVSQNVVLRVINASTTVATACSAADGSFSIPNILPAGNDVLAVFATSTSGVKAVTYTYDPLTNIADYDLYENTVIVRNEQSNPITNALIDGFDKDQSSNIPARVVSNALTLDTNTKLLVWDAKSFAPGGNVSIPGNTNTSSIEGDLELRPGSTWTTNGADVYTIGGDLSIGAGAHVAGTSGDFTFTSAVAGRSITSASPSTMTNLTFNGAGSWTMSGIATTTGDVTITTGTVTLPSSSLAIGGSFLNSGTFSANGGAVYMTATSTGRQIRTSGSAFKDLTFLGTGAWSFLDNATTTGNFTIASGTPTLPAGALAVGGDFQNIGGGFNANGGTLSLSGSGTRLLVPGGSTFANLRIANGDFSTNVANATTTGDVYIDSGSLALPTEVFSVGGTFKNIAGAFSAGASSTVRMTATTTGKLINPGNSTFTNLIIDGAGGGFTIEANATTTKSMTIKTAAAFVQSPSTRLVVQDLFTNNVGGTWTGSTLRLEKTGVSSINTKSASASSYSTIDLGPSAQVSVWNASSTSVSTGSGAALYAQNYANVNGALQIYGQYVRNTGADYWSATTNFDGTPIASRTVNVRFAPGSSGTWNTGTELHIVGTSVATTSVQSISGNYDLTVSDGTFEGRYLKVRNTTGNGIQLLGNTHILALDDADLATGVDTGNILSIDGATVDMNAGAILSNDMFALGVGHTSGVNAYLNGTSTNALNFMSATGNLAGEAFDNDGGGDCGAFRWDDSSCQFVDQRYYRWRHDDGTEAVPDSEWFGGATSSWPYRERVSITNNTSSAASNVAVLVKLPYHSQMQADYRDIRFTAADGVTSIPFWIDTYTTAEANVWVKVPTITANAASDIYVYYGNSAATAASNGANVFTYFFDGESGLTGMSGDTGAFKTVDMASRSPLEQLGLKYLRAMTDTGQTLGMANLSAGVSRGSVVGTGVTIRENLYIDGTSNDDTCLTFGANSTSGSNWGFCVSPQQAAKNVRLVKDATKDGYIPNASAEVSSQDITLSTAGWYSARIDWEAIGKITAWLYDPNGNQVANISATDSYNPGSGIGFSYWYQHGGWDNVTATPLVKGTPTVTVLSPQQHGGASWITPENTAYGTASLGEKVRLRFSIRNTGTPLTNQQLELDYAIKGAAPNCESVADVNYTPVLPASSCATQDVCMSTSTYFMDGDPTTPLLSTPKGLDFVTGRIVEDPSNKTTGLDINQNFFTEVEYALQITPNAIQPSYCFRVSDNGNRLVSYTKVAEASVSHPPKISNWNWTTPTLSLINEGGTTTVMATGTVTDYSGYTDISPVATGTIFRKSLGESCMANDNNCYTGGKTQCSLSDCAGISCTLTCTADLQYFAEPTDIGAYAGDMWTAAVHVHNMADVYDNATADATLNTLKALAFTTGDVDFGSLDIGSTTPAYANPTATLQNTGNAQFGLDIAGTDLTTTGSTIPVDNEKVATSTFDYSSCTLCTTLSTSTTPLSLTFPKPVSTTPVVNNLYFGLYIPFGTKPLTHNGFISVSAN